MGAVNAVRRRQDGRLVGGNFDGIGFLAVFDRVVMTLSTGVSLSSAAVAPERPLHRPSRHRELGN